MSPDTPALSSDQDLLAFRAAWLTRASIDGGLVYLVPHDVSWPDDVAGVRVVTSSDADRHHLIDRRPMSWEEGEWRELVTGALGPWAVAVSEPDGQVVSVCHSPVPVTADGAECGVWTHPDHRGRRLAETTTVAWARLVAAPRRVLFYSTDESNLPSRRVAERLGLRLLGHQLPTAAARWPEGDAWGDALVDHHRGRWVPPLELETDTGYVGQAMHPEWFFRRFDQWDWWERDLLSLARQGPALDLGAGAGRLSLWLQDEGIDVTAVDLSEGAVRVCRERGVRDVRLADVNDPPDDKRWRAIFLLCGNLGLGGSWAGNRALLTRLALIAAPDAVLVGDSVEPNGPAELGLRIRYKGTATPWWRQRNIAVDEIPALVDGTGWTVEHHVVALPDHAVVLRRV